MKQDSWLFQQSILVVFQNLDSEWQALQLLHTFPDYIDSYIKFRCKNRHDTILPCKAKYVSEADLLADLDKPLHIFYTLKYDSVVAMKVFVEHSKGPFEVGRFEDQIWPILYYTLNYGSRNLWHLCIQECKPSPPDPNNMVPEIKLKGGPLCLKFLDNLQFVLKTPQQIVSPQQLSKFVYRLVTNESWNIMAKINIILAIYKWVDLDVVDWQHYFFTLVSILSDDDFRILTQQTSALVEFLPAIAENSWDPLLMLGYFNGLYNLGLDKILNDIEEEFPGHRNLTFGIPLEAPLSNGELRTLGQILLARSMLFVNLLHPDNRLFFTLRYISHHVLAANETPVRFKKCNPIILPPSTTVQKLEALFQIIGGVDVFIHTSHLFLPMCEFCKFDIEEMLNDPDAIDHWLSRPVFFRVALAALPREKAQPIVVRFVENTRFLSLAGNVPTGIDLTDESQPQFWKIMKHVWIYDKNKCDQFPKVTPI